MCHVNKHTVNVGLHDPDLDSVFNSAAESPSAALAAVRVAAVTRPVTGLLISPVASSRPPRATPTALRQAAVTIRLCA